MTTLMTTLTVQRPRGQSPEVFHDAEIEGLQAKPHHQRARPVRVYSYQVLSGNVLKVYAHHVWMDPWGAWDPEEADEGMEVAHFRNTQWDMVRSG